MLTRVEPLPRREAIGAKADPVMLEIFNNLFMSIAEQMGVTLQNTAYSVNIKERLDFSCAVFDREGRLVANAPHMPVHLGSMDRSVETIIRDNAGRIRPGDVFALNAPYNGGTHLPDITVCTPVFDEEAETILFWTASRGHHADIGGIAPGSMSPLATDDPRGGRLYRQFPARRARPLPRARALRAARPAAPSRRAIRCRTSTTSRRRSPPTRRARASSSAWSRCSASRRSRPIWATCRTTPTRACAASSTGSPTARPTRVSDQGAVIKVRISVDKAKREATVDFTGTSPQQPTNFNAPEPVTRAAVLYVFRVMVDDDIPMNAGCLRPIRVILPEGSMLSPRYPAAVVAGNVEVSQAVTDTLFAALGALGSAQGTMNNLTFGDDDLSVLRDDLLRRAGRPRLRRRGGGAHAHDQFAPDRPGGAGEPLSRSCSRISTSAAARAARGAGSAGDGTLRRIRFLRADAASRSSAAIAPSPIPARWAASAGELGRNSVRRNDGRIEILPGCAQTEVEAGEAIEIVTPTGGGWGSAR